MDRRVLYWLDDVCLAFAEAFRIVEVDQRRVWTLLSRSFEIDVVGVGPTTKVSFKGYSTR